MSKIRNEAKIKNKIITAVREQLEHRALWLYLLRDEAAKRGIDPNEFSSAAIGRCGLIQGKNLVKKGKTKSLKGLKKTLFTKPAQWVFEMKVLESTDKEIAQLCDITMCGDHGIGERYDSVLDLLKCIAKGDDICALRYYKK